MERDFTVYLCDIYKAAQRIQEYTEGLDAEAFSASVIVQDAVIRRVEIIGEAIVQCRKHHSDRVEDLGDIQEIINFRNHWCMGITKFSPRSCGTLCKTICQDC